MQARDGVHASLPSRYRRSGVYSDESRDSQSVVSDLTPEECSAMLRATPVARVRQPDGTIKLELNKENFVKLIRQKGCVWPFCR